MGYVNFKELIYYMRTNPQTPSLRGIIRPVHSALPDASAAELLRAFVEQYMHMAIVRDENGRTLGLVTLEDVIEEFLGELEDEFDRLPARLYALAGGTWLAGGAVPLAKLRAEIDLTIDSEKKNVSEWIIERLGPSPRGG